MTPEFYLADRRGWTRCDTTTLNIRVDAVNQLQLSIVKETLTPPVALATYAERCLQELQSILENYQCEESSDYRLASGVSGVHSLCRWAPLLTETYFQLNFFVIDQAQGCRLFACLSEAQWERYGEAVRRFLLTFEFWTL